MNSAEGEGEDDTPIGPSRGALSGKDFEKENLVSNFISFLGEGLISRDNRNEHGYDGEQNDMKER